MNKSEALTQILKDEHVLRTPNIAEAFAHIDRKDFVLPEYEDSAYEDIPLPIGHGQTISQPYTVAFMLELLSPQEGERILDVGSGSGWTTALLSYIVGKKGHIYGVELVPDLVAFGQENLTKYPHAHTEIRQAREDVLGLPDEAPFDRILVSASNAKLPDELVEQLKIGGTMVIPVEWNILKVTRTDKGSTNIETCEGFAFVPLVH